MSRSNFGNLADWERKKKYLIRSLFDDPIRAEDSGDTPNLRDTHKEDGGGSLAPPVHQSLDTEEPADNVSEDGSVILENKGISEHSHFLSQTGVPEVEVMQSTQTRCSAGSHKQDGVTPDSEGTDTESQLEEPTESDSSTDVVVKPPKRKRIRSLSNERTKEVGTQTSLDCYERMSRGGLRDIFVGAPKVYRLCSCANHTCV